jgi:membrane-associated phospholipid phosphatase
MRLIKSEILKTNKFKLMRLISQAGSPVACVVVSAALALLYFKTKELYLLRLLSSIVLAISITMVFKYLFDIKRPRGMLVHEGTPKFPSGHATFASAIFWVQAFNRATNPRIYFLGAIVSFCWMVAICYSRLFLKVHTPKDLLAGILISLISTGLIFQMIN